MWAWVIFGTALLIKIRYGLVAKINVLIYDERKNDTNMGKSLYKYGVLEKPCSNTKSKFLIVIREESRTNAVSNQMRKFQA